MSGSNGTGCRLLTPSEVAAHYRVTVPTIRKWVREGRIPYEDIGTAKLPRYRFPAEVILARVSVTESTAPRVRAQKRHF